MYCTEEQAKVIGKIFTPFSINFKNWAIENLDKKIASEMVRCLIYKHLNSNHSNYERTKKLYEDCEKKLENLGFTKEVCEKYSPFNR